MSKMTGSGAVLTPRNDGSTWRAFGPVKIAARQSPIENRADAEPDEGERADEARLHLGISPGTRIVLPEKPEAFSTLDHI